MSELITIRLFYFAKLGDDLACSKEELKMPIGCTLKELIDTLCQREGPWENLRAPEIRCALNHTICKGEPALHDGDEIAFFPPVTGG